MIVFDLACRDGNHGFEGWFASSEEFDRQRARGLVSCPHCGGQDVIKAPMAPHLTRKGNQRPPARQAPVEPTSQAMVSVPENSLPPEAKAALMALARMQAEALKTSRWVGKSFAQDARAMHYGEKNVEAIHGQASPDEALALAEEGIAVVPVLFPTAPPDEIN